MFQYTTQTFDKLIANWSLEHPFDILQYVSTAENMDISK